MTEEAIRPLDQYPKGGLFEAFPSRCRDCTAISTIYGSILWPVDTCFYRCCMFVVLLRQDPIRIFLMWNCHMLQTGCSRILYVQDFFFFYSNKIWAFFGVRLKIQIELERGDIYGLGLIIDWPPLLKKLKFLTNLIVIMMIEDI